VAFAAKKAAPGVSLGTLFLASMWLDLAWPVFLLLGIETVEIKPGITKIMPLDFVSYPYSHSLLFATLWGATFGLVYWILRRDSRGAVVLGVLVVSHWVIDFIVHRPDMPLYPGSVRLGLDLWDSLPATLIVELAIFGGGVAIYLLTTRPADRIGRYATAGLALLLLAMYVASLVGPPPPGWQPMAYSNFGSLLFPLWAWWADKHRTPREGPAIPRTATQSQLP
jgi:FtsH-binding integral membrane protein